MKKIIFEEKECYIAYKVLHEDLSNFKENYTYETENWYSTLEVDMTDESCSYGCNLFKTIEASFIFMNHGKIFKCYVPIKNNKIKFINNESKFRCLKFYLTNEEVFLDYIKNYEKYWNELTEDQKERICIHNINFNYEKYWNELTEYQKNYACRSTVIKG